MDKNDVKLCNCAGCEIELLGTQHIGMSDYEREQFRLMELPTEVVRGRVNDRPYCAGCYLVLTGEG